MRPENSSICQLRDFTGYKFHMGTGGVLGLRIPQGLAQGLTPKSAGRKARLSETGHVEKSNFLGRYAFGRQTIVIVIIK